MPADVLSAIDKDVAMYRFGRIRRALKMLAKEREKNLRDPFLAKKATLTDRGELIKLAERYLAGEPMKKVAAEFGWVTAQPILDRLWPLGWDCLSSDDRDRHISLKERLLKAKSVSFTPSPSPSE